MARSGYLPGVERTTLWTDGTGLSHSPLLDLSLSLLSADTAVGASGPGLEETPLPLHPALLAKDSVVVGQGLVHAQVCVLLLSSDRHREAQEQGCCGQPHGPAHGHLERKESSELPGPQQGVPFPPTAPAPGGPPGGERALCSAGRRAGTAWAPAANPPPRHKSLGRPWASSQLDSIYNRGLGPSSIYAEQCRHSSLVPAAARGTSRLQSRRAHISLSHGPPHPGHTSYPEFPRVQLVG